MKAIDKKRIKVQDTFRRLMAEMEDFIRCAEKEYPFNPLVGGPRNDIAIIQQVVADFYELHEAIMRTDKRPAEFVRARFVAMVLCRHFTKHSLTQIGESFGGRDQATVANASKQHLARLETEKSYKIEFQKVRTKVENALKNQTMPLFSGLESA